jgi:hypothetical protein
VETLDVAATPVAIVPPRTLNLGAIAVGPSPEPDVGRWPGWMRLAFLVGASAGLWAGLGWVALRILKLG